ncbi:MAG: Flp1 family type IVb pilin [Velocimicrobium sp.]
MKEWNAFLLEEDGIGVVEIILILVVLIGLVLIFKEKITELVKDIFSSITSNSDKVMGN